MSIPRGIANKNPGNIEKTKPGDSRWHGEIDSTDSRFAQFSDIAYGYRAMFKIVFHSYANLGKNTIEKIISTWAPPLNAEGKVENNTEGYIQRVCHDSGIPRTQVIMPTDHDAMIRIIAAMSAVENGIPANLDDVKRGFALSDL